MCLLFHRLGVACVFCADQQSCCTKPLPYALAAIVARFVNNTVSTRAEIESSGNDGDGGDGPDGGDSRLRVQFRV